MNESVWPDRQAGGARRANRAFAAALGLLAGVTVLLAAAPAHAQVPPTPAATATPLVGVVAPCSGVGLVAANPSATSLGVTVGFPAGGQCAITAATTSGEYQVTGVTSPTALRFNAACALATTNGGVDVPPGTIVNGGVLPAGGTVTTLNTPVIFPGGQTATLNVVTTTATTVTRQAIVFGNGVVVGQVTCPLAYPLAVEPGSAAGSPAVVAPTVSAGDHGRTDNLALLGGGLIIAAVLAQVTVARRIRRRRDEAAG